MRDLQAPVGARDWHVTKHVLTDACNLLTQPDATSESTTSSEIDAIQTLLYKLERAVPSCRTLGGPILLARSEETIAAHERRIF